jgi:hypothetical protein
VDRPHNSDELYATVAGHEKHESAVDEKARGHGAQHVRARGLALKGFKRPAKATGLTRVLTGPDEPLEPLYAPRRGDSPSPAVPGADAARDSRQDRGDKFQILSRWAFMIPRRYGLFSESPGRPENHDSILFMNSHPP